ncbi:hypothetical protein [Tersicoccus sp. Bi-70]|nr:hypothetical protein [Tersicoccus sp. Bi-70]
MSADLIQPMTPVAIIEHTPLEDAIAHHDTNGPGIDSVVDLIYPPANLD